MVDGDEEKHSPPKINFIHLYAGVDIFGMMSW